MRLKTAPRVVIGLALCGGIGYGVNTYLESRPKPVPAPEVAVTQPPPVVPVQEAPPVPQPQVVQPAPQPQVVQPAPQPQPEQPPSRPANRHDAGLNALINGGTK
jgi:hypothetical protein